MSLFSTHEIWCATIGSNEEFDQGTMCVANIDNESNGSQKIITGSFQGVLRIYYPRGGEYRIEDLMVEQFLGAPILQLTTGYFIPSSKLLALAVLHPRHLVVYQIAAMGGAGKSASYYSVVKSYEHHLNDPDRHFTAGNMVSGSFGSRDKMKQSLCVQSMDGRLQFYEQDHYAFSTPLLDCLVPGPLCYCGTTDSIITCNSKRQIVAYKYRLLASSSTRKDGSRELDWYVNIGEYAFDIFVCGYSSLEITNEILVLGEHSMFCISEEGKIRMQKRLDYTTSACHTYARKLEYTNAPPYRAPENLIVATRSRRLLIYRDAQLVWAAKQSHVPVAIHVASFCGIDGLIVSLSGDGRLALMYLGTDSPTSSVIIQHGKKNNYTEMDEEYRTLLKDIRFRQRDEITESPEQILSLRSQVPEGLDILNEDESIILGDKVQAGNIAVDHAGRIIRVTTRLFIAFNGKGKINNVNISVCPRPPIFTEDSVIRIRQLKGGSTPLVVLLKFFSSRDFTPSSRIIPIVVSYVVGAAARTVYHEFTLPLAIFAAPVIPVKTCEYKFTVESDKNPIQISELFSAFIKHAGTPQRIREKYSAQVANVLSLKYANGEIATVLVSKNSGKYRMQGSSFEALCLLTVEVMERLRDFFLETNDEQVSFVFCDDFECRNENLLRKTGGVSVFEYYWEMVEKHFLCRQHIVELEINLNERAQQFRAIQKRLLVRFKDKNPQPLNNLDTLLGETYKELVACTSNLDVERLNLVNLSAILSCCTELIIVILSLKCALDKKSTEILKAHLTPLFKNFSIQGWEECVDSAMTHLLRTTLAKSAKDSSTAPLPIALTENTIKFKRHFDIVCKRLLKKRSLYDIA